MNMTPLEKTTEVMKELMNGICGWLNLTMENEDMFGGWLPTLDLEIKMTSENKCIFQYFEKKMIPNMVLHRRSAMPEATRRATLNQELIRRMTNTSEMISNEKRVEIVDKYAEKLMNSEYSLEETRSTIVGGLKGYERLLSLSLDTKNPRWKPLHLSAGWNARNRRIAKLRSKTSWYKGKQEVDPPAPMPTSQEEGYTSPEEDQEILAEASTHQEDQASDQTLHQGRTENFQEDGNKRKKKRGPNRENITLGGLKKVKTARKRKAKNKMRKKLGEMKIPEGRKLRKGRGPGAPIRSVIFVDNTSGGELARRLQEAEMELGSQTGYRVKVAESAGTPLGLLLPSTNPWGPIDCTRRDCVPCNQDGEKRIDCRKRNVLYENKCKLCNEDQEDGKGIIKKDGKGVYVGESARSLYERAKEHHADKDNNSEDSHMIKHWLTDHQDLLAPPAFRFGVVQTFQDPLTRQLSEAIRIERTS